MRPLLPVVCMAALMSAAFLRGADVSAVEKALPKVRIVLVGDSTVTAKAGWGDGFAARLVAQAEVINASAGGRSSMSFVNEGRWKKSLELKPDYVLIQFGHNDQKLEDPNRGTEPGTTYRRYMTKYVDEARAAGIKPVLVTSLSRRAWGDDGKVHSTLGPYVEVVREIARSKEVPLIDLHARSIELYEKLGRSEVNTLSPRTARKPNDPTRKPKPEIDPTHLNEKGSSVIGSIVVDELAKAVPALAGYVKPAVSGAARN